MIKYKYWRGGRVVEGARLEIVYAGNRIGGSNPPFSATKVARIRQSDVQQSKSNLSSHIL